MPQLFSNNASSVLFTNLTIGATTMTVTPGDEPLFPSPSPGEWFDCTIESGATREIVRVTSVTSNVFSITRAQEGTSASAFTAGATIDHRLTAGWLNERSPADISDSDQVTGTLDVENGGTGLASYTAGDLLVALASNLLGVVSAGAASSVLQGSGGTPAFTTSPIVEELTAENSLAVGAAPSVTGGLNLENSDIMAARNNADSGDLVLIGSDSDDNVRVGGSGSDVVIPNDQVLAGRNNADSANVSVLKVGTDDAVRLLAQFVLNNATALAGRDSLDSINIPLAQVNASDQIILGNGLSNDIGIGENSPTARVHLGGSVGFAVREVTSNFSFGDDFFVAVDASGQNTTATLPALSAAEGRVYVIKRTDNNDPTTTLTVQTTGGDTIEDGVATSDTLTAQNEVKIYIGSSSEWKRIVG